MKCSSYVVVPYKPDKEGGDLDVRGFMYHGERNTDFVHPGCGGNDSYIVLNTLMTHANCRNGFDLIVWNYYDPSKNVDTI